MEAVADNPIRSEAGPLRNGNPRGNPHLAPRCGATTRAGKPCAGPAMTNGRCRMHGGKSTGAKTEAGKQAQLAAVTRHGYRGELGRVMGDIRRALASRALVLRARTA